MDDPVSRVDPTGLWSKENFDESKVSRDGQGQFASTPGRGGGAQGAGGNNAANGVNNATAPQSGSGWLVANAGTTATDAPGWLVAAASSGPNAASGRSKNQLHERIRQSFGDEALEIYRQIESLEQRLPNAATEQERTPLGDEIKTLNRKLDTALSYGNTFSQGFRHEQIQLANRWKAYLVTEGNTQKYLGMMDRIEKTPPEQRAKLLEEFYTELGKDAEMPQLRVRVVPFGTPGLPDNSAAGVSNGFEVKMNLNMFTGKEISWENALRYFFHEQGHEWQEKLIADKGSSGYVQKYPQEVERLKHAKRTYMHPDTSRKFYQYDYLERHAQQFEEAGYGLLGTWRNSGKGKKK